MFDYCYVADSLDRWVFKDEEKWSMSDDYFVLEWNGSELSWMDTEDSYSGLIFANGMVTYA